MVLTPGVIKSVDFFSMKVIKNFCHKVLFFAIFPFYKFQQVMPETTRLMGTVCNLTPVSQRGWTKFFLRLNKRAEPKSLYIFRTAIFLV